MKNLRVVVLGLIAAGVVFAAIQVKDSRSNAFTSPLTLSVAEVPCGNTATLSVKVSPPSLLGGNITIADQSAQITEVRLTRQGSGSRAPFLLEFELPTTCDGQPVSEHITLTDSAGLQKRIDVRGVPANVVSGSAG